METDGKERDLLCSSETVTHVWLFRNNARRPTRVKIPMHSVLLGDCNAGLVTEE